MLRSLVLLRRGMSVFACLALMLSMTAFLVGGPLADTQHQVAQDDRVSDGGDSPTTWLGRSDPRSDKRVLEVQGAWLPQDEPDLLPVEQTTWVEEPAPQESQAVPTDEPWGATFVRGPPGVIA